MYENVYDLSKISYFFLLKEPFPSPIPYLYNKE